MTQMHTKFERTLVEKEQKTQYLERKSAFFRQFLSELGQEEEMIETDSRNSDEIDSDYDSSDSVLSGVHSRKALSEQGRPLSQRSQLVSGGQLLNTARSNMNRAKRGLNKSFELY